MAVLAVGLSGVLVAGGNVAVDTRTATLPAAAASPAAAVVGAPSPSESSSPVPRMSVVRRVSTADRTSPARTSAARTAPVRGLPSRAQVRAVAAGLVDIDTILDGGRARGAGTGIVLTSDGTVLTNAHVVAGASRIAVTDLGNGRTYRGVVVGRDPAHDVAVVRAVGATGLRVAPLSTGPVPRVGSGVVGIGNAGGIGTPSAATGVVVALGQQIVAGDEGTGTAEKLTGMIATTAPLRPGDSGGAMVDGTGQVVGLDTAAAADASSGFAIPIARALAFAQRIA